MNTCKLANVVSSQFKSRATKTKASLLILKFAEVAKTFVDSGEKDDRIFFVNVLRNLFLFLRTADKVYEENCSVAVALNSYFNEQYETLEKVANKFKDMGLA